jgi:leucyl/phenylalanyl-tRNA---protein transferase
VIELPRLGRALEFPPLDTALTEPEGLLAWGGDLSVPRLLAAYRRGIFPWFGPDEPILWWSLNPRLVLPTHAVKISRSLAKVRRNRAYRISTDQCFAEVIHACAAPRQPGSGSWIVPAMIEAYIALHQAGHAHSVEVWMDEELVGGLYGVAIGRMFFGESMFSRRPDASKLALVQLCEWLAAADVPLIDCQMQTRHLVSMGAHTLNRADFQQHLRYACAQENLPRRWVWQMESQC